MLESLRAGIRVDRVRSCYNIEALQLVYAIFREFGILEKGTMSALLSKTFNLLKESEAFGVGQK